ARLFFSSRRRHPRSKRDWSSDVCSSDLVPSGADHGGCLPDVLGVDSADKASARRSDLARAGGVRQQLEPVQHLRIASLRGNNFLELPVAGAVEKPLLRELAGIVERWHDLAEIDHARGVLQREPRKIGGPYVLQRLRNF